jgi:hypothetical protein
MGFNNINDSLRPYLPGDFQAEENFRPENTNFLTTNKFVFILNRCPMMVYYCQRVNIPSITTGVSFQTVPLAVQIQRPGTSVNLEDLQVGFAVDEDMKNWMEIYDWIKNITMYSSFFELKEAQKTSDASILVLNSSYNPIVRFKFYDVFPNFLSGFDFDSTIPDTSNIIATVSFSYTHVEKEILI